MPPVAARCLRLLVAAHSPSYRERYAEALMQCVEDEYAARERGRWANVAWFLGVMWDIVRSALLERPATARNGAIRLPMTGGVVVLSVLAALYCVCCVVPWLLTPAGVTFAADVYQYRPLLLVLAGILLAGALWINDPPRSVPRWAGLERFPTDPMFACASVVWGLSVIAPWIV